MKVLLIGHSCSPVLGSEPGFCWNWAKHLATSVQVWLICHPQYKADFDRLDPSQIPANLQILWTNLPPRWDPWDPQKGLRGLNLHYLFWLREAYRRAYELHGQIHFDVVHQVTMGTISVPSPFWRLGIPFFWGPLGGGQNAPFRFRRYFGAKGMAMELARSFRIRLLPFTPGFRKSMQRCAMAFATNEETLAVMRQTGSENCMLLLDSGVYPDWLAQAAPQAKHRDTVTLLWCGSLTLRKSPALALEALAKSKDKRVRVELAGEGPLRQGLEQLAASLGIQDQVSFLGQLGREALKERFRQADGFLFTSLRDSFGSVVLEAMAAGLPVVMLAHQGVGAFVPTEASLKIPVTNPEETVASLAEAMRLFADSPEARGRMARASWNFARANTWEKRAVDMISLYQGYIVRSKSREVV